MPELNLGHLGPAASLQTHSPRHESSPGPANLVLLVSSLAIGLAVDQYGGLGGQLLTGACFWAVFFWLLKTSPREWRVPFYACLVWATAGEIYLSLVWGLYTYRLQNIPLFIPPGHVLMLYLGLVFAPRVPRAFVALVPVAAIGYAAFAWINGFDTMSIPLIVLFMLCMLQPEGRRLYAVMFVASLILELYGTWIGNWVWHRDVPYLGLSSANPPLAAGAFYCVLDVLVVLTARTLQRLPTARAMPATIQVSSGEEISSGPGNSKDAQSVGRWSPLDLDFGSDKWTN
jgi:hypothetical protein